MSDRGLPTPHDEAPGAAHAAVRDALPAFLSGRVTAAERATVEAHLAACPACAAELRLLGAVRAAHVEAPPSVSVDRIAAAVRARTVSGTVPGSAAPRAPMAPPLRRTPAWARRGALQAFAATALVALGSSALLLRGAVGEGAATPRASSAVASAPSARAHRGTASRRPVVAPAAAREKNASLLGSSFSDLNEDELAAVVAAVDDPASASPGAEPTTLAPAPGTPGLE